MAFTGEGALARVASHLGRMHRRLNPGVRLRADLALFTDPDRLPDPVAAAWSLPRGALIVHRTFGRAVAEAQATALAEVARRRDLVLLIGLDDALAARVGAHGVHLPECEMARAPRLRARRPEWILTTAAHGPLALVRAAHLGLDAGFVSPVFESASPSAGRALGVVRLAELVRKAGLPVYALGGVDDASARRLLGSGVAGLAAVGAFRT